MGKEQVDDTIAQHFLTVKLLFIEDMILQMYLQQQTTAESKRPKVSIIS